ncbi:MAG: 50S ribosomal protein L6 [Candidatus Micrarchaeota archaeon]
MDVKIPEGISVEAKEGKVSVKGPLGELQRGFNTKILDVKVENSLVTVTPKGKSKREGIMMANTLEAHLKNMLNGVSKKFEKKLQVVYSHFPISVEVKGKEVFIKNFLGEKTPRKAVVRGSAGVEAKGQEITVSGISAEEVGQTASNIIRATRITKRDERIFQDGIYLDES